MDQQDLAGAQLALADGERADHVVGDDAARVTHDVSLTHLEAQQAEDVDPRVHAGDDRQVLARADVEVAFGWEMVLAPGLGRAHRVVGRAHLRSHPCASRLVPRPPRRARPGPPSAADRQRMKTAPPQLGTSWEAWRTGLAIK